MAAINSSLSRAVFFFMVFILGLLLTAAEVRAQDGEFTHAPAPAPTMDAGSGFLVTYSGAFVCSSLILSLLALLFH